MNRKFFFFFAGLIYLINTSSVIASNKELNPFQIQAGSSLILGNGGAAGVYFSDWFYIGGEVFNRMHSEPSIEDQTVSNSIKRNEKVAFDFQTRQYVLRLSPFNNSFYFQGGSATKNWMIDYTGNGTLGNGAIDTAYNFKVEFPESASSYGIGANWVSDSGFSGGLAYNILQGGQAKVTSFHVENGTVTQADIDLEIKRIEEDALLVNLQKIPYMVIYIGWNF